MSGGVIAVIEPDPRRKIFTLSECNDAFKQLPFYFDLQSGQYRIETGSPEGFKKWKIIFMQTSRSPEYIESILTSMPCVKKAKAMNAPYAICEATPPTYQQGDARNQEYVNGNTKIGK